MTLSCLFDEVFHNNIFHDFPPVQAFFSLSYASKFTKFVEYTPLIEKSGHPVQ